MTAKGPFYYSLHFEEGVFGRAWLNDLPLHKTPTRGPESMNSGANHFLVPGKNKLALEILRLPPARAKPPPPKEGEKPAPEVDTSPVGMKVYRVVDASTDPIQAEMIKEVDIPVSLGLTPWDNPDLPFYHTVEFELPYPVPEPVYWRSPPVDFSCGGTPELIQAVVDVHEALASHDLRRFLELITLKHEAYSIAFPGETAATVERQRASVERFFAQRIAVKPLELTKLHFEPRLGGRVAFVSGWDDRPVLEAVAEDHPGLALRANLLLTQHEGRFRVFG